MRTAFKLLAIACSLGAITVIGCGETGPGRYHISGKVTFDGKPLKFGTIQFEPDKGNSGPQGTADIHDGEFDTVKHGTPPISGKLVARINGYEREASGNSEEPVPVLFQNHEVRFDMPTSKTTKDFDIPKSASTKNADGAQAGP